LQRGQNVVSINSSFVNVVAEVMNGQGQLQLFRCEVLGGCLRAGGGSGEIEIFGGGAPWLATDELRSFDWPAFVPANPYTGTGGTGDLGAGIILMRHIFGSIGGGWVGSSAAAGTSGLRILAGAKCEKAPGPTPTAVGPAGEIEFSGGDAIPSIGAGGVPVAGAAITSWATLMGAPYNGNAVNLKDGTTIYTAP
jgi:hypothetical protein